MAIIQLTVNWCPNGYWRGNFPLSTGRGGAVARKAVRRNRKRKNMAVKLFGADRDLVVLLAGSGAIAILIILATMS